MQKGDLVPNKFYAYRVNPRNLSIPWRKAKYVGVAHAGQARIEWADGETEGAQQWVKTGQLVCRWSHRQREQKDAERARVLREDWRRSFDQVLSDAVNAVMEASGDPGAAGVSWEWCELPATLERVWARAGLVDLDREQLSFVDRHGRRHMSFASAVKWARGFAAAEPGAVAMYLDREVEEMTARGFRAGESFSHDLLRQYRPAFAVARSWSQEADRDYLTERLKKMDLLVQLAAGELERAGCEAEARKIRRALSGL